MVQPQNMSSTEADKAGKKSVNQTINSEEERLLLLICGIINFTNLNFMNEWGKNLQVFNLNIVTSCMGDTANMLEKVCHSDESEIKLFGTNYTF